MSLRLPAILVCAAAAAGALAAVEQEIATTRAKLQEAVAEADRYSGGLLQAMSLSTVATTRNSLAMLEQRRLALKYSLPQFVGFSGERAASSPGASQPETAPTATPEPRRWSIVEVDSRVTESNNTWWRYAWKLAIRNDHDTPQLFDAVIEFQDADGFVIDSANEYGLGVPATSERTFTGSALVSVPGALRVSKTNAKVGVRR